MLYRQYVRTGEKGSGAVGTTKRGKGTKLMAVADSSGLPLAVSVTSASPHEVTLVEQALVSRSIGEKPKLLIAQTGRTTRTRSTRSLSVKVSR